MLTAIMPDEILIVICREVCFPVVEAEENSYIKAFQLLFYYIRSNMVDLGTIKNNFKEQINGASEYLSDLKEDSKEKMINSFNNLSELVPIIAETGYRLKGIDIELSLPPGINMRFEKFKNMSREAIDEILEKNKEKEMLNAIVNSLVTADEFHNKLKMGDLVFRDISLKLGLPPKVTIAFVKKEG